MSKISFACDISNIANKLEKENSNLFKGEERPALSSEKELSLDNSIILIVVSTFTFK